MSKLLIEQLRSLKKEGRLNPDRVWVENTRSRLMHQIGNTVSNGEKHFSFSKLISWFMPKSLAYVARPTFTTILIGIITVGGWIAGVNASYNSLPGEVLYGVKIATEKTQVAFASITGDKEVETKLHLEFATRRSSEAKKVMEVKSDEDASKKAQGAVKKIKDSIESANKSAQDVGGEDIARAVSIVKDIAQTTQGIKKDLEEVADSSKEIELNKEVVKVASAVKQVELDAIENVVTKSAEKKEKDKTTSQPEASEDQKAQNKESDKEIAQLVSETIIGLSKSAEQIKKDVQVEVRSDVNELDVSKTTINSFSKETIKTLDQTVTTTDKMVAGHPSGEQKTISTDDVGKIIKDVVDKVDETVARTGEILQEAKVLVDGNNLLEAIHKAKEAHLVTKETAQAVVEVKDAVKKVQKDVENAVQEAQEAQEKLNSVEELKNNIKNGTDLVVETKASKGKNTDASAIKGL